MSLERPGEIEFQRISAIRPREDATQVCCEALYDVFLYMLGHEGHSLRT